MIVTRRTPMTLHPWFAHDPFRELARLSRWATTPGRSPLMPHLQVAENAERYLVRAELPGIAPDALELTLVERTLTLTGKREAPEVEGASYHRRERFNGEFKRSVALPGPVDGDAVEARFVNGVLTVTLPKPASAQPRRIPVNS